jgi:hypothetical protein
MTEAMSTLLWRKKRKELTEQRNCPEDSQDHEQIVDDFISSWIETDNPIKYDPRHNCH